jgi:hypothetical protein
MIITVRKRLAALLTRAARRLDPNQPTIREQDGGYVIGMPGGHDLAKITPGNVCDQRHVR